MKKIFATLSLLFVFSQNQAQSVYHFKDGLAIGPCHQYGREALYTDQLAYQLYKGTLKPQEGGVLLSDAKAGEVKWKKVQADSTHRFRGDAFSNGYVYLTYESSKEQAAILTITGQDMIFLNGVPRGGDMYRYGWMHLPVLLKKGKNEIYARVARFGRFGGITANLTFPTKQVSINTEDLTISDVVPGFKNDSLWTGVVISNMTKKSLTGLEMKAVVAGKEIVTRLPSVPAMSLRKVGVLIDGSGVTSVHKNEAVLTLSQNRKVTDLSKIAIQSVEAGKQYSRTFVSDLDGSVQYYAVSPQIKGDSSEKPALFFSVHGAEVQAISQARAYKPKDWGVLVAPTNRRPRGFNWEDWGRMDALEVLDIAKKQFSPDPSRIYLTGHSMGGHGTWFLGATYPEKWAAIAPSAGYPTLASYGSHDGVIPDSAGSLIEAMLLRASNPSNVLALTSNYKSLGVYVAHGDADRTVPVTYARQMRDILGKFHRDFSYYEHIGGEHWYGDISVDWPPIFNFFSWHAIPRDTAVTFIDFKTANPGISSRMRWAAVHQQINALKYSQIKLSSSKKDFRIDGTTENVALLSLDLDAFVPGSKLKIVLDSQAPIEYDVIGSETIHLKNEGSWKLAGPPAVTEKNAERSGTLKDAFRNRMVYVYATGGNADEKAWAFEKATFDAESWYYRGNGAVDIVADKDFDPQQFKDRGVILYGNKTTNLAWDKILKNCPVTVTNGKIDVGGKQFAGNNLAAYFIYPRSDSKTASVTVISGTGKLGFQAANANQYFSGGSGFPDLMIFSADMLRDGIKEVKMSGFFGNDWSVEKGEFVTQ
ncbi:prolyl oligopeptidase family serine peptidase [Dyadobacter sp. CY261]|uniref:carboxylesterase family protein n=1 Tax=Dyadobacter sp. CY261 TaxID=2907203 RepID=UPI001EEC7A79|nr:PHB depolymerase family esterase [Dyadobacter sp. CY261]MCF0070101.1 prolyl oligopeptidase family serine peptidase [Dyadobacter sp. CY261]